MTASEAGRFSPPRPPEDAVVRRELDLKIDEAAKKKALYVNALAGYGKTASVVLWLEARRLPAAWIPLTVYDNYPSVFCRYLVMALNSFSAAKEKAVDVQKLLEDSQFQSAPFEHLFQLLPLLPNPEKTHFLILDDFHLITDESILKTTPQLIKKLPANWKFVFISRFAPPATFADLVLKNELGFIRDKDLRFNSKHIIRMYQNKGINISFSEAAALENDTAGWVLGLSAMLLARQVNTAEGHETLSGEQYISDYLKTELWGQWDESTHEFLLRTSILEDLPVSLCDKLWGESSLSLLRMFAKNGLAANISPNVFCYHHIFRDFLRQMAAETGYDLSRCYITAADSMFEAGRFPVALDFYVKSGDNDALNDFLRRMADFNITNTGVEEYFLSFQNLILETLPPERLENSFLLVQDCVWTSFLGGNRKQMLFWLDRLNALISEGHLTEPQFLGVAVLLNYVSPLADPWAFTAPLGISDQPLESTPSISLTMNLPFLHRAHRDYSDIVSCWKEFLPRIRDNLQFIIGPANAGILVDGIAAGILLEQNKLKEAHYYALKTYGQTDSQCPPEIWFSVYLTLAMILKAQGETEKAMRMLEQVETMIRERNVLYLNGNLKALGTRLQLEQGDVRAANVWLESYITSHQDRVTLFQSYQAMTTARALIAKGEFHDALLLLSRIETFAVDFNRPLDRIEAILLSSVALWNLKNRTDALTRLKEAVNIARPYGYVRQFADCGADLLPILKKLPDRNDADEEFTRKIILFCHEQSKNFPGITSGLPPETVKLSPQQTLMLNYLSQNKTHQQICEETGLKKNTVKAHLYKLYEKLEVNNASDAVLKGQQLGLIDVV